MSAVTGSAGPQRAPGASAPLDIDLRESIARQLMGVTLPIGLVACTIAIVVSLVSMPGDHQRLVSLAVCVAALVLAALVARRGRARLGVTIVVAGLAAGILHGMYFNVGVHGPGFAGVVALVIPVVVVHGLGPALTFIALITVASGVAMAGERGGWLPPPNATPGLPVWVMMVIWMVVALTFCIIPVRRMRQALEERDAEIVARRVIEDELARHRERLEEVVAQRTAALAAATSAAEALSRVADAERAKAVAALAEAQRMESSLQAAKEAADRANRAKSDFLSSMSHEIRTPLNAVLGYAQLLGRDQGLDAGQRKAVAVITSSGAHLLELITDILEMSRIEAGRSTCDASEGDLHALLDNLRSLFLMRAQDAGLELVLSFDPDLPRFVRTDQRKLRQVLVNLLANALKFTSRGGVTIAASLRGERLILAVRDTGCGIAAAEQAQLFQPFSQTTSGKLRGDGTGLGLALSQGFARILGGGLSVVSAPGAGSTFTLDIPVTVAAGAAPVPAARRQIIGLAPGQRPPQILIAEDHTGSREALADLMTAGGCAVRAVGDGAAAVACCAEQRPDLVWMDIDLPVLDGLAAVQAIRAQPAAPPVLVALTAAAFADDVARLRAAGCDAVVHKPYREDELFSLMERLLGVRFAWREPAPVEPPHTYDEESLRRGLAALPAAARAGMREAVVTGDLAAISAQSAAWADQQVGAGVRALADAFALERLQRLIAGSEERP